MTDETLTPPSDAPAAPTPDTLIAFGRGAVKAIGDGSRVGGYLAIWGDPAHRDLQGEYFTKSTDFRLDLFPARPVFYQHTLDPVLQDMNLGIIDVLKLDDTGLWAEAKLDMDRLIDGDQWEQAQIEMRRGYMQRVLRMVERGELQWSSGALPHMVKTAVDGEILKWAIFEGSLTPTPAEPRDTGIRPLKAMISSATSLIERPTAEETDAPTGMPTDEPETQVRQSAHVAPTAKTAPARTEQGASKMDSTSKIEIVQALAAEWGIELTAEQLAAAVAMLEGSNAADLETVTAPDVDVTDPAFGKSLKAIAESLAGHFYKDTVSRGDAVRGSLKSIASVIVPANHNGAPANSVKRNGSALPMPEGLQQSGRVSVGENLKYAHLKPQEMALGVMMMNAYYNPKNKPGVTAGDIGLSEDYMRHFMGKAIAVSEKEAQRGNYALKANLPFKADELNASNITGQGAEWVGTWMADDFWQTPRGNRIFDRLVDAGMRVRTLPQGYGTYEMYAEGTDPIVYSPPEANDLSSGMPEIAIKQSPIGTVDSSVTPGMLGARVIITNQLIEDSLIGVLPQRYQQMTETMLDHRDKLVINADTVVTENANINLIDGTPATGDARPYYLAANGLRKYGLVTNAATQAVDAQGNNNLGLWRLALSKLRDVYWDMTDQLVFITNALTLQSTMAYPELSTADVARYGSIENGRTKQLYGVNILGSTHLPRTNAAGKVSGTAANNIYGTLIAVHPASIVAVIKREITMKTFEYIRSDATEFVVTTRLGFGFRDAQAVSVVYNIGNATSNV